MSSDTSSRSSMSDEDFKVLMDQKKRKRMQSNRESARRSRMRKQQHLDELMDQASKLREENGRIVTTLNMISQQYLRVEAENSVLNTQMMELSTRLQSLNEILTCMNSASRSSISELFIDEPFITDSYMNPWNPAGMSQQLQPVLASMDMFQYC